MSEPATTVEHEPNWHAWGTDTVLHRLGSHRDGLDTSERAARRDRYGANRLDPPAREGVLVVAGIETVSELRARRALDALREMTRPHARVVSNGRRCTVPGDELVPGDVIVLDTGDQVPGDARVISAQGLRVDEASLTGESVPVDKRTEATAPDAALPTRRCSRRCGSLHG